MTIESVTASGSSSTAQTELLKAQQKLATDLAAKAAEKVITADQATVAKVEKEVAQQRASGSTVDLQL
ncbi:MAG: hypothetical protein ABW000_09935 [Actinoplanes sp.]